MGALNGGGARVELRGGAVIQIRFDFNALIDIEDDFGSLEGFETALSVKPFRTLRYAAFKAGAWLGDPAERPTTEEAMGLLLDPAALKPLSDAVAKAMMEAVGVEPGDVTEPADPTPATATPSPS